MQTAEPWRLTEQVKFGAAKGAKSTNNAAARGIAYHQRVYKVLKLNFLLQPGWTFTAEPWFRGQFSRTVRSPDGVALLKEGDVVKAALVIEVKMNWKDGRDDKLIKEYVPIVSNVYGVKAKPLLITRNVRGLQHQPLTGLADMFSALSWAPGLPTPVALVIA